MPDHYSSVADLLVHERPNVKILTRIPPRANVAILAPHAGDIEPMTGELADAIAGTEHRLYLFVGRAPQHNNRLHITSTRFDEPCLHNVLAGATFALSLHGARGCDQPLTVLGGLRTDAIELVGRALEANGFRAVTAETRLAGRDPRNLVNRVPGGGVQLELSRVQRQVLFRDSNAFALYVQVIRRVIEDLARAGVADANCPADCAPA